ncbi:N-acetylmuramoyl-L-alanine amidase [Bacteroides sp. 519]|uniref:N-acetylmuramoyl-L-alanine amidase family protein n=1 Tax=Bacteroides sp. 519 TaxID=2302937 RepID=UPI0013D8AC50|nr:N-acetylmuramoyl-L-alanine amidase [Bacteroides sp. 519]NDV59382.1 N-acetylmuramoyl-L-alanine amidase [Bacteroides sp. 519]
MLFIRILLIILFLSGVSSNLYAQEKVYPKDGDGITSLLRRYNRSDVHYHREFLEINKKRLGRNNALILGVAYTLPPLKNQTTANTTKQTTEPKQKKGYEPLFGSANASFDITSTELEGATFYISSGHGGPDPGACARFENHVLHEDEYAYDISLRLARNLMMKGAKVYIIIQDAVDGIRDGRILINSKRETCMGAEIPLSQVTRLKQRTDKINELESKKGPGYSRAIFIHIDSQVKNKKMDVFFYHSSSEASRKLTNTLQSTFDRKYARHQPSRGFTGTVSQRGLYVLENSTPVAAYVELGNIQNMSDLRRIIQKDNRQALANWLCEGLVADYKSNE